MLSFRFGAILALPRNLLSRLTTMKEKQLTPEELYVDLSASVTKFYQELKFLVFQSVRPKTY